MGKIGGWDERLNGHDEYFAAHLEADAIDGDFGDHFDKAAILDEVHTTVTFFTDATYRTSRGEAIHLRRSDIDGSDFDNIIEKHRR